MGFEVCEEQCRQKLQIPGKLICREGGGKDLMEWEEGEMVHKSYARKVSKSSNVYRVKRGNYAEPRNGLWDRQRNSQQARGLCLARPCAARTLQNSGNQKHLRARWIFLGS